MRPPLSLIPLLPATVAIIIGIVAGRFIDTHWIAVVPVAGAIAFMLCRRTVPAILCAMASIGCIAQIMASAHADLPPGARLHSGYVTEVKHNSTSQVCILETGGSKALVSIPAFDPCVSPGHQLVFRGTMSPLTVRRDLPDEISHTEFLLREGVTHRATVPPADIISVTQAEGWRADFIRWRQTTRDIILRSPLSPESKEFLSAVIVGDPQCLSPAVRQSFTSAGIAHILALSGLHVGIIAMILGLMFLPLRAVGKPWSMRVAGASVLIVLWLYVAMTGFSPSATRATVMTSAFVLAEMLQRRYSAFNALCLAAIAILIFDPGALLSAGFQLSFAAVAGVLLFAEKLNPVPRRMRVLRFAAAALAATLSATLSTAMLSAYYFHIFPLGFLIANLPTAFLLPVIVGGGLLLVLVGAAGIYPSWLCHAIDLPVKAVMLCADKVASYPGLVLDRLYFSSWLIIPYFMLLGSMAFWLYQRRAVWGAASVLLLTFMTLSVAISSEQFPGEETFVVCRTYHTDIISRQGDRLYIYTTAPIDPEREAEKDYSSYLYKDYMGRRALDSLTWMDERERYQGLARNGNLITAANRRLLVVSSPEWEVIQAHYLLVCRGFTGSITELADASRPDTILLSRDLHPKRHDRYADECRSLGIPFISLKDRGFKLPVQ